MKTVADRGGTSHMSMGGGKGPTPLPLPSSLFALTKRDDHGLVSAKHELASTSHFPIDSTQPPLLRRLPLQLPFFRCSPRVAHCCRGPGGVKNATAPPQHRNRHTHEWNSSGVHASPPHGMPTPCGGEQACATFTAHSVPGSLATAIGGAPGAQGAREGLQPFNCLCTICPGSGDHRFAAWSHSRHLDVGLLSFSRPASRLRQR